MASDGRASITIVSPARLFIIIAVVVVVILIVAGVVYAKSSVTKIDESKMAKVEQGD